MQPATGQAPQRVTVGGGVSGQQLRRVGLADRRWVIGPRRRVGWVRVFAQGMTADPWLGVVVWILHPAA